MIEIHDAGMRIGAMKPIRTGLECFYADQAGSLVYVGKALDRTEGTSLIWRAHALAMAAPRPQEARRLA